MEAQKYTYTQGDKVCRRNSLQIQILPTPKSLNHRAPYCLPVTGSTKGRLCPEGEGVLGLNSSWGGRERLSQVG